MVEGWESLMMWSMTPMVELRRTTSLFSSMLGRIIPILVVAVWVPVVLGNEPLELVGRWPFGPAETIDSAEPLVVYSTGTVVQIADLSDPTTPTVTGEIELPTLIEDIAVAGNLVHVANGVEGLRVIDISTPSAPEEIGRFPWCTWQTAVADGVAYLSGDRACPVVKSGPALPAELWVLDLSDPTDPTLARSIELPGGGISGLVVDGDVLFVRTWGPDGTMLVFAIDEPLDPTLIAVLPMSVETAFSSFDVEAGWMFVSAGAWNEVLIFDVRNPLFPHQVGTMNIGPATPSCLVVSDRRMILCTTADDETDIRLYDTTTPTDPVLSGSLSVGVPRDLTVVDDHLVVADARDGIRVADICTPKNMSDPTPVGAIALPGSSTRVTASGTHAYVSDEVHGLRVLDIGTPETTREIARLAIEGGAGQAIVSEGFVFALGTDPAGVHIVDVTHPALPTRAGFVEASIVELAVAGSAVVGVGSEPPGIRIIDATDPYRPVEQPMLPIPGDHIAAIGGYAYVSSGFDPPVLHVLDVRDPTAATEIAVIELSKHFVYRLAAWRRTVYALGTDLRVIDVSRPWSPSELGYGLRTWGGSHGGLAVSRGSAFLWDDDLGLVETDVRDPLHSVGGSYTPLAWPVRIVDLAVSGDLVIAAVGPAGVSIYRNRTPPVRTGTPSRRVERAVGGGRHSSGHRHAVCLQGARVP
jgi:hypothetical protein